MREGDLVAVEWRAVPPPFHRADVLILRDRVGEPGRARAVAPLRAVLGRVVEPVLDRRQLPGADGPRLPSREGRLWRASLR